MPEILDNLTPAERAEANHTNLIEAFDYLLSLPDVERHPHADLTGVITGQPAGFLNPITVSNFRTTKPTRGSTPPWTFCATANSRWNGGSARPRRPATRSSACTACLTSPPATRSPA